MDRFTLASIEKRRLAFQAKYDRAKTPHERNRLGQFATPTELALDILGYAKTLLPNEKRVRFLDPAFGTGSFYSALLGTFPDDQITVAEGYEIDKHYLGVAAELWKDTKLTIHNEDFIQASAPDVDANRFNLIICNPPYVRHHHLSIDDKNLLRGLIKQVIEVPISGLAGLYCYFLILSHKWIAQDGIAGWLIPSEFMDVNYGRAVKHYLLNRVTLLRIHRFNPNTVQFNDALVSSAVVWFRKTLPKPGHLVEFTFGDKLASPTITRDVSIHDLRNETKWTRFPVLEARRANTCAKLSDLFVIKRGLATGDNSFFILTKRQILSRQLPMEFFRPVLPSPRYLQVDEVNADDAGNPLLKEQLFLLDCSLPEGEVMDKFPRLWDYLKTGIDTVATRYLCRTRSPWYRQENRQVSTFLCTYMGRQGKHRPFRFILNHSQATATNSYLLLYLKPSLARALKVHPALARNIWTALNNIDPTVILNEGRIYGGGLHKVEPKELANVPADSVIAILNNPTQSSTHPPNMKNLRQYCKGNTKLSEFCSHIK